MHNVKIISIGGISHGNAQNLEFIFIFMKGRDSICEIDFINVMVTIYCGILLDIMVLKLWLSYVLYPSCIYDYYVFGNLEICIMFLFIFDGVNPCMFS